MRPATIPFLVLCAAARLALAEPARVADPKDRQILAAFLTHVERSADRCTRERMARFAAQPEDITWQASQYIRMPLVAFRLTAEPRCLDLVVQRLDALCACLSKGPDGFLGWYGLPLNLFRHPDHPTRKVDVILTSFEVTRLMADFARAVQADDALAANYGKAARRYLAIAEDHLVKKWDARGRYKDLGDRGAVYITHAGLKPVKASLTQPHNKHSKIIQALLSLYIATGHDAHLVKALKLGARFKRCLSLVGNRYRWNYWDPAGPWDVHPDDKNRWKHWIGSEHRGGYYALTLTQAVVLYQHGLLFDRADVDRFLRTQTTVCWNGDLERPRWARVDGRKSSQTYLCRALTPFDDRLFRLAFGPRAQAERLASRDHSWQGGVVARDWLDFKHVVYPAWKSGEPAHKAVVAPFLAKPSNRALLDRLALTVQPPGYKPPTTPADMKPMPAATP